jgi:two-component system CheB/CheR fusion protein
MVGGRLSSEEHGLFRSLPEGAALLEIVRDPAGTPLDYIFLDVNPAYERLFGTKRETEVGRRLSQSPFPRAGLCPLAAAASGGGPVRFEAHFPEIDKQLAVSAFAIEPGRLTLLLSDATAERISELERGRWLEERALLRACAERADKAGETDALFRNTVENIPVNLVLYDRNYRILYINPAVAAMCAVFNGRTPSEIVGRQGPEIWPAAIWNPLREHSERALQTRERQTYELEIGSGEELMVGQWAVVPLIGPDGEVQEILAISYDVTAQRRLVDHLRETDRRKGEFIAVLSHELRNPLAAMRSSLYVLEHGAPGSEVTANARQVIERQVEHLARMVDDLLDVTRIARNKIQLQRQTLDLREIVRQAIEDNRAHFEGSGVRLKTALGDEPVFVHADATRIAQVVTNLISNAMKFTPAGGTATVSVARDDQGSATLQVVDSGIGVDPALLPRLFEPFMQADHTLDRPGGGLGLGLALVKGLVNLHGGEIRAHSSGPGMGTELTVRLPLAVPKTPEPRAHPVAGRTPRRRVLVIEDDRDVREGLQVALQIDDHQVEVARTGAEGLEKARQFDPEVVLCDIGLPGMNGYDVARAFRADPALRSAFLVALSGYAQAADLARATEAGFDHHLAKPSTIPSIQQAIAAASGGRRDPG